MVFLKPRQLFVCFQDGIRLCTKLRNRLLFSKTIFLMGKQYASVNYRIQLINNYSKIDHCLTISDVCQKDKQNFLSFEKISSAAALPSLKNISNFESNTSLSRGNILLVSVGIKS